MHNVRVNSRAILPLRPARLLAPVVALGLVLAGCSSSSEPQTAPTQSPSPSSTVPVPDGVKLTPQGTRLAFGSPATVIDEPDQDRASVLKLTVDRVELGSIKDFSGFILDDQTSASTPYYVNVKVENVGESDLGNAPVPLWAVDADNTLVQASTFTTPFAKCPSKALPAAFGPGDTFWTCLVYLAADHGEITSMSFRPDQAFDPITWKGEVTTPSPKPVKKPSKKSSKKR